MSYEKLYDIVVVDLGNDTLLPMILSGSSNCSEWYRSKYVPERNWWPLLGKDIFGDKNTVMTAAKRMFPDAAQEQFYYNGKFLSGSDVMKKITKAIDTTLTLEDYKKAGYFGSYVNKEYVKTGEELKNKIEQYVKAGTEVFIDFGHYPLKRPKKKKEGLVVLKTRRKNNPSYVVNIETTSTNNIIIHYGKIEDALLFSGEEEAIKAVGNFSALKAVSLKTQCQKEKEWVIWTFGDRYVSKMIKNRLWITDDTKYAMRFATETAAQKYLDEIRRRGHTNAQYYKIIKLEDKNDEGK